MGAGVLGGDGFPGFGDRAVGLGSVASGHFCFVRHDDFLISGWHADFGAGWILGSFVEKKGNINMFGWVP